MEWGFNRGDEEIGETPGKASRGGSDEALQTTGEGGGKVCGGIGVSGGDRERDAEEVQEGGG